MYSLSETFQQCKVIPGKAKWHCREGDGTGWDGMGRAEFSFLLLRISWEGVFWDCGMRCKRSLFLSCWPEGHPPTLYHTLSCAQGALEVSMGVQG